MHFDTGIFSKMRNTKYIYVILIIGVIIMLLSSVPDFDNSEKNEEVTKVSEEKRLEEILSDIEGVGEVSVMFTYYASNEKVLAYEKKTDRKGETSNGFGGESSDEKAILADGEPVVLSEVFPTVRGVVVIAEGAGRSSVNQAITEAVSTALGVAVHKICVLPKRTG